MGLFKPNIKKMKSNGEIKELISLLNTEDEKVRGDASKALSELDSTAVEMLIGTLRDSEGAFRALVVTTLSKIGAPAVDGSAGQEGQPDRRRLHPWRNLFSIRTYTRGTEERRQGSRGIYQSD